MTTKLGRYGVLDDALLDAYPEILEPLPDPEMQERPLQDIKESIRSLYGGRSDAWVSGHAGVYYEEGNPEAVLLPDCYVVFGEGADQLWDPCAYRVWEFGKPPDFVMEVGSKGTWPNDLGHKRDLYARLGVGEYWRYDPSGGDYYGEPLVGECLQDGAYRRFDMNTEDDGSVWAHSPVLALELWWKERRLQFYNPATDEWLGNVLEQRDGRLAAEAGAARWREQQMATQAEADRRREELRRLRGE